jgi:hypothetical protein
MGILDKEFAAFGDVFLFGAHGYKFYGKEK